MSTMYGDQRQNDVKVHEKFYKGKKVLVRHRSPRLILNISYSDRLRLDFTDDFNDKDLK